MLDGKNLLDAHQSGVHDYSSPLWTLLMFEAFLRASIDGGGAPAMPATPAIAEALV